VGVCVCVWVGVCGCVWVCVGVGVGVSRMRMRMRACVCPCIVCRVLCGLSEGCQWCVFTECCNIAIAFRALSHLTNVSPTADR
jgi:hypothetical protein